MDATPTTMCTEDGGVGYGSGESMVSFEAFAHLFVGSPLISIDRHVRVLETINFHACRCSPLKAALRDAIDKRLVVHFAVLVGGACVK
jgi:hypothetical protein